MFDSDVNVNICVARRGTAVRGRHPHVGATPGTARAGDVRSAPAAGRCQEMDPPT